jgi:hypothetical protein
LDTGGGLDAVIKVTLIGVGYEMGIETRPERRTACRTSYSGFMLIPGLLKDVTWIFEPQGEGKLLINGSSDHERPEPPVCG